MEIIRKYENEKNNLDFGRTGRDIFRKDLEDLGEAKVRAKNPEMVKQVIDYLKK
jgi:hypothetical protein